MQTWLHISTAIEVLSLMKKWKWSCVCLAHAYHGQWNCISACSKWKFVCHSMWEDVLCLRAWTSWFFISFCSSRLQSLPLGAFCLTCLWNAWLRLEHVAPRTLRQSWVIVVFSLVFFLMVHNHGCGSNPFWISARNWRNLRHIQESKCNVIFKSLILTGWFTPCK